MSGNEFVTILRPIAMRFAEAEEGIACKGTAIECTTFKTHGKAFLFVGGKEIRLKLQASLAEAGKLAAKEPERYQAGKIGWVTVRLHPGDALPIDVLERWIDESYRLLVPKQLAAKLAERDGPRGGAAKTATKKVAKKRAKRKTHRAAIQSRP
jgi:YjbR